MKRALKGLIPESWCCIDCGYNTAPGLTTRAEAEKAFETQESIKQTINNKSEVYIVHDSVWKSAGMELGYSGCLCIRRLERRLGRELDAEDFPDHVFNNPGMPGTKRLKRRERRYKIKVVGPLDRFDRRSVSARTEH
jgi:hypothetical protein